MARGGPKFDDRRRRELAEAFLDGGAHYEQVRPGYPDAAVDWILPPGASTAVDLGAGTGKLTGQLVARGLAVTAVDPSPSMLAELTRLHPGVAVVIAPAEATTLPSGSADLVVAAQAWHWFDPGAASREAARLLAPGGRAALVWNQLDTSVPWVHRLSRIMHAGDVHKPDYHPPTGPELTGWESAVFRWEDPITPEGIIELTKSRSYYLRASEKQRARVEANLAWYLHEHLGHRDGGQLLLPYITQAWRAVAATH
ncbi:methyltransferase domain-containing protein [Sinomonas sp. JGH33]|uniref:Methyltransferase domain-containing protein n=1 Tax=Sinomonas terricola TaxID=3110330 RepID=A0ABU5T8L9_9MICC|nr:methyltransferase domain-containing protein [Sinomonas sp. JGH33]MEA5456049.1 methyltransferase domain-containing protein [Sinomonas sp. JGH33]